MIRALHTVFAVAMAFLVAFGGMSKEYLHLFSGHQDTETCNHHRDGLYFESEHHHCDFLSYTLTDYTRDAAVYFFESRPAYFRVYTENPAQQLIPSDVPASHLRGPPVLQS